MIASVTQKRPPLRLWEDLSPKEQETYGGKEERYVDSLVIDACAREGGDRLADCGKRIIHEYYDESQYRLSRQALEPHFRLSAAITVGLSLLPGIGPLIGLVAGFPLAFGAGFELHDGKKHRDKELLIDGAFNLGIGTALIASAFHPGALSVVAPALVGIRELYLNRRRILG